MFYLRLLSRILFKTFNVCWHIFKNIKLLFAFCWRHHARCFIGLEFSWQATLMAMLLNVVETYVHCIHIAIYSSSIITYVTRGFGKYLWTLSSVMQQSQTSYFSQGNVIWIKHVANAYIYLHAYVLCLPSRAFVPSLYVFVTYHFIKSIGRW